MLFLSCSQVLSSSVNCYAFASNKLSVLADQKTNELANLLRLSHTAQGRAKRMSDIDGSIQKVCVGIVVHSTPPL